MQAQLAKEAWGAALQRAKGDKVLDDPRLLKRSLKKVRRVAAGGAGSAGVRWPAPLLAEPPTCSAAPAACHACAAPASHLPLPCARLPPQEAKLKAKKAQAWQDRLTQQAEQRQAKQQK